MALDRRMFLRGLGTTVALPFLSSLAPRRAFGQSASSPLRVLYYYNPNGNRPEAWVPRSVGANWVMSPALRPLETLGVKDDVTIISGLDNAPANVHDNGAHFRGTAAVLTANRIGRELFNAVSVDQIAAAQVGGETLFRSLQIGLAAGSIGGRCGSDWPCPFLSNISWSGPETPMGKEVSPSRLFDRLFAGTDQRRSAEAQERRKRLKLSVLDFVREDATTLQTRLGRSDGARLDEYLTQVRELELRLSRPAPDEVCEAGERPDPATTLEKLEAMEDLMVLAFKCDLTRIITFMTWNGGASSGTPNYPWVTADEDVNGNPISPVAVNEHKHDISHHQNRVERLQLLQAINKWEVFAFARLVAKMKAVQEGDRTLLDNAIVVSLNEYGDPNAHDALDLPCIVAGGGGGRIIPGRHLAYPSGTPWANLLRTILDVQGVSTFGFGDSDGPLAELVS